MDYLAAIVLGIVEGITEFLPISSTGHLIIVNKWFTFSPQFSSLFNIVIQFGAICAVLIFFREKLYPWGNRSSDNLLNWKKTLVAVIPALIIGGLFGSLVEEKFFNTGTVAVMLIVGGIIIILAEKRYEKRSHPEGGVIPEVTYAQAIAIGFIQCLALIPGTSRSAATIIGGLLLGVSRVKAAEFSFFLAIPTIIAASGYKLIESNFDFSIHEGGLLVVGLVVSFLVAWAVIKIFMKYIQTKDFKPFGYYRILLGAVLLLLML